jgi:putative ABC transport system permease protein
VRAAAGLPGNARISPDRARHGTCYGSDREVSVLKDVAFAFRMVRRSPGFAAVAILTLGLGIGANTAIFSLIDTIFLHGLRFTRANELFVVLGDAPDRGINGVPVSITRWEHFRDNQSTMVGLSANTFSTMTLTGRGDPAQVTALQMSSNQFDLLGLKPEQGRLFRADEETVGEHVAILSDEFWSARFERDPSIVGKPITLSGVPHVVVGVMPPLPTAVFFGVDLYTTRPEEFPGITPELKARGFSFMNLMGRARPGVTLAQVQQNMDALVETYKRSNAEKADAAWKATVVGLEENVIGPQLKQTLWMLLGAVAFVLLIATSNVANLLLVRFSERRREISVRLSLGADRRRVVRLFLFESLIISSLAALVGLAIGRLGLQGLTQLNNQLPIGQQIPLSGWVLGFTVAISTLSGVAMGLYPSIQASGTNIVLALKEGGRANTMSRSQHWFRMTLLGGQVALSCVLLMGAFLVVQSVANLQRVAPGFEPAHVLTAGINLPASRYPTKVEQATFETRFLEDLRHAPGVTSASLGIGVPLLGPGLQSPYSRMDGKFIPYPQRPLAPMDFVSSDYFATLGIRIVEGREFTDRDRLGSPMVSILSASAARTIFPEGGALGRHMLIGSTNQGEDTEIVGIADDVHSQNLRRTPAVELYRPLSQRPGQSAGWQVVVKTAAADPTTATSTLREALRRMDRDLPLVRPSAMPDVITRSIGQARLMMTLLGLFASVALLIAIVGIYSVVAYTVNQRKSEIGVRLALGALPGDVVRLVMRQGMTPVLLGLLVGIAGAFGVGAVLKNQLFGTGPLDPLSFAVTITSLLVTAVVACGLPSWRASRIAPSVALR